MKILYNVTFIFPENRLIVLHDLTIGQVAELQTILVLLDFHSYTIERIIKMYKLKLSRAELDSLAWVGDRYESAGILYDGLILADCESNSDYDVNSDKHKEYLWQIPEHIAWEYMDSLETENGCGMIVPTCIGGTLADKLIELYERIV